MDLVTAVGGKKDGGVLGTVGEATQSMNSQATGDSYILIVEREKNMLIRN